MNSQARLEDLVAKYIEEKCCQHDFKALEALLLENAGNREYFLEIVMLAEHLGMLNGSLERKIGVGLLPVEMLPQGQWWRNVKIALLSAAALTFFSAVAIWPQMACQA